MARIIWPPRLNIRGETDRRGAHGLLAVARRDPVDLPTELHLHASVRSDLNTAAPHASPREKRKRKDAARARVQLQTTILSKYPTDERRCMDPACRWLAHRFLPTAWDRSYLTGSQSLTGSPQVLHHHVTDADRRPGPGPALCTCAAVTRGSILINIIWHAW